MAVSIRSDEAQIRRDLPGLAPPRNAFAFDQGAVDYVLKPVTPARLFTAVSRVKQRLGTPPARLDSTLARIAARSHRRR